MDDAPDIITPGSQPLPEVLTMAERLAPFIRGPKVDAVCGVVETVLANSFGVLGTEFVAALDTRDPVWRDGRPEWHLTLLEREAGIPVGGEFLDMGPADRYRAVRMRDVSRWSEGGKWSDLLRLAAAWMGAETADPSKLRVFAWPLVVVFLFHPSVRPVEDNLTLFRQEMIATIMDVAGWGFVEGYPDLILSFDKEKQGWDLGEWGDIFDAP